jgi:hypothetical protein
MAYLLAWRDVCVTGAESMLVWCGMLVYCLVADHVYVVLVLRSSLSVAVRGQMP